MFSIFLALVPNLSVDNDCSNYYWRGLIHNIIKVREFPPNEDLSIFVKGELR
jgi:hypothetical protein